MGYYFEMPSFTDLTNNQRLATEEEDAIALSGGPGTGKTVVSLWRHIRNYNLDMERSLLLTYSKTLEYYLVLTAKNENEEASNFIARTYCWLNNCPDNRVSKQNFYEIIIDEAQDIGIEKYEIIKKYSNILSYGADEAQSLYYPKCSSMNELRGLFSNNEEYELSENFRNSREILQFTKSVFPNIYIPYNVLNDAHSTGLKPIMIKLNWDNFDDKIVENIIDISKDFSESTHNIGILVPLEKHVDLYYNLLSSKIECSKYHNKMDKFIDLNRIHITTFKSAKGLEFDTVIIPSFDSYEWYINNLEVVNMNDYYVALTRAKLNLYLLCKKYVNTINEDTYEKE